MLYTKGWGNIFILLVVGIIQVSNIRSTQSFPSQCPLVHYTSTPETIWRYYDLKVIQVENILLWLFQRDGALHHWKAQEDSTDMISLCSTTLWVVGIAVHAICVICVDMLSWGEETLTRDLQGNKFKGRIEDLEKKTSFGFILGEVIHDWTEPQVSDISSNGLSFNSSLPGAHSCVWIFECPITALLYGEIDSAHPCY